VASALAALGNVRRGEGRLPEAIAALERSLAIREARETPHEDLGESRFFLARALWDGGGDRTRARSLARLAAEDFGAVGSGTADARAEVEAWLQSTAP
jgi:eukaryotic-like serine/threonine-protein kinase